MSDGVLMQGSREIPYRNISFIRGVIAGDIDADSALKPGEARLAVNGREFPGSLIEITDGEAVFSAAPLEEIVQILDPDASTAKFPAPLRPT
ncbi:MAG TPA: hypothetical protein VIM61_00125 [Chthoniobacterales bacterium]|jgi:hypothetical protein